MLRKRKDEDNSLLLLLEVSAMFWPAGLVISGVFTLFGVMSLSWALGLRERALSSPVLAVFANSIGLAVFGLPVLCFLVAMVSASNAVAAYREEHRTECCRQSEYLAM